MLLLDETSKDEFKKPLGKIYPVFDDAIYPIKSSKFLISVGDATTHNLLKNKIYPNISIIDNLIQRKRHDHDLIHTKNVLNVKNPPGTLTEDIWKTIKIAIKNTTKSDEKQLIVVEGEEDLTVLPCILIAPENTILLYGQPNKGLVLLNVSDVKNRANELLKSFKKKKLAN